MGQVSDNFQVWFEKDGSLDSLRGVTCGVIGFGHQGSAQALNARDSGLRVIVSNRANTPNGRAAEEAGFVLQCIEDVVQKADFFVMALPDEVQPHWFEQSIAPHLRAGQTICFAHGFNIHFKKIIPPQEVDVVMVAPKGAGYMVRGAYQKGGGIPCLLAVKQDTGGLAHNRAMAWAIAIGAGRAGIIPTTFQDECEMDLFGEQVVLCGGVVSLVNSAFEVLVESGYSPEVAYFEVCHELKLIVDLIHAGGLEKMHGSISNTAAFGGLRTGAKIIDESTKQRMRGILHEIQSGQFAEIWGREYESGSLQFKKLRQAELSCALEQARKRLVEKLPDFGNDDEPGMNADPQG